jgi:hypothetical protein
MLLPNRVTELDTSRPFTLAQAAVVGLDARSLRSSRFRRLLQGVYIDARVPLSPKVRALAALALHPPTAFVSHQSAAALRGLPVPRCDRVHVTVEEATERAQVHGLATHVKCRETEVELVHGVRVSTPLDLFIELAGQLSLLDAVVVGDAMVGRGHFTADELRDFCRATRRWHSRRARRAASYVRDGVDSPMETRLRMLIVLAGLPEPTVNHKLLAPDGRILRRFDLSYPLLRLIIEYDGRHHVEVRDNWESDLDRREEIEGDDWRFIVVTQKGVYLEPERTVQRVAQAIRRRGGKVGPVRDTWKLHFAHG